MEKFIKDTLLRYYSDEKEKVDQMLDNKSVMATFKKAFVHKSIDSENNYESLEKVGDAIFDVVLIKYVASQYLKKYKRPISESQLAYTKDWFKSNYRMTEFAQELMFDKYVKISKEDSKTFADVFEAFIGALDFAFCTILNDENGGYRYTYTFIISLFSEKFANGKFQIELDDPNRYKDPTTIVFEVMKARKGSVTHNDSKTQEGGYYSYTYKITRNDGTVKSYLGTGKKKKDAKISAGQQAIKGEKMDYKAEVVEKGFITSRDFAYNTKEGFWFITIGNKTYKYNVQSQKEAEIAHLKAISKK